MICSGKGGTGKSTVSVLLGAQLAANGKKVLLVEL
ncbi:MAG: AAA family ATPase, partial [Gemmiger sp.]|nr:AAA family ATPase [Gemmiger sp.]